MVDGVVRYIGKGSGRPLKRAQEHLRTARRLIRRRQSGEKIWAPKLYNRLAASLRRGQMIEIRVIAAGLTHSEAFAKEVVEISRAPAETLWNLDNGGSGGGIKSEESRKKMSVAGKRRARTAEGRANLRKATEASHRAGALELIAAAARARAADPAYREKLGREAKARWADPDLASRMNAGLDKGRRAPRSAERNAKRWADPEARRQYGIAMKAWWADPDNPLRKARAEAKRIRDDQNFLRS